MRQKPIRIFLLLACTTLFSCRLFNGGRFPAACIEHGREKQVENINEIYYISMDRLTAWSPK
ncbi:hypothetical protein [Sediminibacterium ginsengisoli]|uniref:hypothetical protein n=1 Tax=Sediminibacterium ginsengisoli TaxID=413434 RepID=UPI001115D04A|nr:hypothetical protein [Sediminibacterium ginsengisoli]